VRQPATGERRWAGAILLCCLLLLAFFLALHLYTQPRATSLPPETPPALLPLRGLNELERLPDGRGFRWTNGAAELGLPNPGGAARLAMLLAGGPGRTLPLTLTLDGRAVASFLVAPEPRVYQMQLPPAQSRRLNLGLLSPSLRESGRRTIGVVLGELRVEGGGGPPLLLIGTLALGIAGLLVLLRQAGLSWLWIALLVATAQALLLVWQTRSGWRYGLAEPLLALVGAGGLLAVALERWLLPPARAPLPFPPYHASTGRARGRGALITFPSGGKAGWWTWGATPLRVYGALAAVLTLALAARLPWLAAPDPVGDLELSARRMAFLAREGLAGAYVFDGDYMPLRLYMLLGMSRIAELFGAALYPPLPPATKLLLKLPALLADATTTAIIFFWGLRRGSLTWAAALGALYALTPPVWINVAWWGQVDGLLMLPMLGAVLLLGWREGWAGWAAWALALLIKPQAIILAPLLYAATLRLHGCGGLLRGGALAFGVLVAGITPLALAGQGPGLAQAALGSVGRFPQVTNDAYNLWYLVAGGQNLNDEVTLVLGLSYRQLGLLLMGGAALLITLSLLRRADPASRALAAACLALAFFCLPTQIHQRYLFLVFAFLALRLADTPRLLWAYATLLVTGTLGILGSLSFVPALQPLIAASPLPLVCATLNLLVLAALLLELWRDQHEHSR
jgi:hypothetical protein